MFEKIVTHALMSPSQIGVLKRYYRSQKTEIRARKVLLLLIAAFICLQYVGLFYFNNSDNSGSDRSSIISGGFSTKEELLLEYDTKKSKLRDIASLLHISRDDLTSLQASDGEPSIKSDPAVEWTTVPTFETHMGKYNHNPGPVFTVFNNKDPFVYYGYPLHSTVLSSLKKSNLFVGNSKTIGTFFMRKDSGNIITSWDTAKNVDRCFNEPGETISYLNCPNGESVKTNTIVNNITYKTDAEFIKNRPGDRLLYTLQIRNNTNQEIRLIPTFYLGDLLEYVKLDEAQGALLNNKNANLIWEEVTIPSYKSVNYSFSVKVYEAIPLTARGNTNKNSYNCKLDTYFGKSDSVSLLCPTPKVMERLLNSEGSQFLVTASWLALIINFLLLIRAQILEKEAKLLLNTLRRR